MRRSRWVAAACALALTACAQSSEPGSGIAQLAKQDPGYSAIRFETSEGPFTAILYPEAAPETVARYLEYVDSGYYVGRSFDRVVPGFVIQATDCAISVLTRDSRTLPLETAEDYFFSAGALGIARAADPDSGGSEFFVMDFAAGHLYGDYTVFGQVIEGMDVIRRAARKQAINFTTGGAPAVIGDRCAIQPVDIKATRQLKVNLSAEQAARLPLKTAPRVKTGNVAYNLEWPATLAGGRDSDLTAYITVYDESTPPEPRDVTISIASGPALPVEGDATAAGIYHFHWTPPAPGEYQAVIRASGQELATLIVHVP